MGNRRRGAPGERAAEGGFTLIEIMIVIAIIGLVASFALPALRDARLRANETAAIGMLRSLHTAQGNYKRQGLPSNATYRGFAHYLREMTEEGQIYYKDYAGWILMPSQGKLLGGS